MANYEITTKAGATYQLDLPDAMSETEVMDYFNNRYLPSLEEEDNINRPTLTEPSGDLTQFNKPVEQPTPEQITQMQSEANPKDTSDFSRGFKTSYEQLPELGYGLEAGAYAIGETAFGEGGMLTQGKQEAVGKMIAAQKETQANAKESDSFTYAYQKAKEGNFGALADTVQYGLGYGLGQGTQAILAGGIGEVGAKLASEMFAKEYTAKLVEQEALKIAEQNAGRDITQSEIERQAVKNVAESIGTKGRDYALGAQAVGLEGGEILGDLAKQSTEQNRALTPWEVSRGLGATALAAAGEFYADRFGLDILGGKRLSEAGKYTEGLKGNLLRGAATGGKGAGIEGGTEFGQTLIEEAGKGKDPFSSESFRQAIDASALGAIGGGAMSSVGGLLSSAQQKPAEPTADTIEQTATEQTATTQTSPDWQRTMGDIRSIVGENQLVSNEVIAKDIAGAENIDDALQSFNHIGEAISTDHAITHELKTQEQLNIAAQRGQDQITAMQEPLIQEPVKAKPDKLDATQESLDFISQAVAQGGAELKGGMLYLPTGEKYSLNKAQRDHYTNLVTPIEQAPETPTAEMPTAETLITEVQTQEQLQKLMNSFQEGDVIVSDTGDRFPIESVIRRKNGVVSAIIIPPSEEGSKRFTLDIDGVNALINPQGYYDQKTNERKISGFGKVERAEMPTVEMPTVEMPTAEMPTAEMPTAEIPTTETPVTTYYNEPNGKYYGDVKEVTKIMPQELKPLNQTELNGAISSQKASGKSEEEWAKSVDLSEPIKATIYSDGEIKIQDGHHRYLAAKILNIPLNVELKSINAKNQILNDAINRINKDVSQTTVAETPTADYETRNSDRIARINKASTPEEIQSIYAEETSDNERHFEGTRKAEIAVKDKLDILEREAANKKEDEAYAAGEWVFHFPTNSLSDANQMAKSMEKIEPKNEYRVVPWQNDKYLVQKRNIEAASKLPQEKTGTVENPILKKNGSPFPSQQSAQTYIRTNPELSKDTHTWIKLDMVKYGADKYGIVARNQVAKKTFNPAENLNKVNGTEELKVLIGKLGGLDRTEMAERGFTDYKNNTRLFNNGTRSRTFDDMATLLNEQGFSDINGPNDLETALWNSLNGKPYYGYEGIDNAMDKMAADKADQDEQEQEELLNTYTTEEINAILDAQTQAEKDKIIADIKAEKKRKADLEVNSVVDEMLGKGMTTSGDIFAPERKGKAAVGREVTIEGEQLANSPLELKKLYPNHWFYGNKGAQSKFDETEIDYETQYPNLESVSLINTDTNIGGFYDQVEQAIYQTSQSDRTTLHELGHAIHHQLLNYRKLTEDERVTLKELLLGDAEANHPYLASDKELVAEFNLYAHVFPVKAKVYAENLYKELIEGRKDVVIKLGSQDNKALTAALKQANVTIEKGYGEEEVTRYKRKEWTDEERASQKNYRLNNFERERSKVDEFYKQFGFTTSSESDDFVLYSAFVPEGVLYSLMTKNINPPIGSVTIFKSNGQVIIKKFNYFKTAKALYGKEKAQELINTIDDKGVIDFLKNELNDAIKQPIDKSIFDIVRYMSAVDSIDPLTTDKQRLAQVEKMLNGRLSDNAVTYKSNIKFSKAKSQQRLAPNGKPSNLNAIQYDQVRTPEFKEWFGDWENDPANASKVVDENGEPLVVYHGSQTPTFTEFKSQGAENLFGKDNGFYFTTSPVEASAYANENADNLSKGRKGVGAVMPVYLNIKNVANITDTNWNVDDVNVQDYLDDMNGEGLLSDIKSKYDGILYDGSVLPIPVKEGAEHFVVFDSNQIKSATGNTGAFSKESNDIRFSETQQPITNTHTEQSLKEGLTKAGDDAYGKGWTDRLLGTGMFEIISDEQAQAIIEGSTGTKFALVGDRSAANTQIDTTMGAYAAVARNLFAKIPNLKNILDYGAGKGRGTASVFRALTNKGMDVNVKSYEPFPENWAKSLTDEPDFTNADNIKDGSQDAVVNLNVLNVVPRAIRDDIVKNIGRILKDGGVGVISSRRWKGDVDTIKPANSRAGEEPNSFYVTRKLKGVEQTNYQKGIEPDELVAYVQELLPDFDVRKINGYGASAVIIQKSGGTPILDSILKPVKKEKVEIGSAETEALRKEAKDLGAGERYSEFGVGKKMGDEVYLHKDYEGVLPQGDLADAKERIDDFEYNLIRYNTKTGAIGFFNSPDFDTSPEPINGNLIVVEPDGTIRTVDLNKNPDKQAIYHHKWEWVKDDYDGFDVKQSIERSITWQKVVNREGIDRKRIGFQGVWQNEVLKPFDIKYSQNGDIEAFFNPADGKTYFVAENIDKEKDLHYLMMHEVSVHMLKMGANEAEFENFLKETDNLVKVKNPAAMQGRQDALDADTPEEDLREETLAYLIKYAPKLKIVQRFKAWLKNALRNMSKMFPASQKLGFIQWANKLSDQDLLYIANATLRKAPELLLKKSSEYEVAQAQEYFDRTGFMPYLSEGQLEIPIELPKFAIKTAAQAKWGIHSVLGIPMNKNETVSLYYPTTNAIARRVLQEGKLVADNSNVNRIYLTNESAGYSVMEKRGAITNEMDGAVVLIQIDPSLVQIDDSVEHKDGRRDFFIPIGEGEAFMKKPKMIKLFTLNQPREQGIAETTALAEVGERIAKAIEEYKTLTDRQKATRYTRAKKVLKRHHNITTFLTENRKLEKTRVGDYGLTYEGNSVASQGLGLASAQKINNRNLSTCPVSAICEELCLGETSGQNLSYGGKGKYRSGARLSQYLKTEAMVLHPEEFAIAIAHEIKLYESWANQTFEYVRDPVNPKKFLRDPVTNDRVKIDKEIYQPAMRLNVTSDIPPTVFEPIMKAYPNVEFYDYTKLNSDSKLPNLHITYSSTGVSQIVDGVPIFNKHSNWRQSVQRLDTGFNVAMVFSDKNDMPKTVTDEATGKVYQVWNGDNYDARFLDPKRADGIGMIIGLTNKDNTGGTEDATERTKGFFVNYNKARDGDNVTILDQSKFDARTETYKGEKATSSIKFSKSKKQSTEDTAKEGKVLNRATGYSAYENAKPISEEVDNEDNYPDDVSLEEEKDWVTQQLRRFDSFQRLNDKSNELINKYLTTMGKLPELGKYLGMRYKTLGKIDNVDDIVRNVFDTLQNATKEDSKEIYTYLTDNKATTEFIIDPQMAQVAKDLKEAIQIIGKKLVEFNIIPMESYQMYEGRYLPRVYLEHIIQSSDRYQSLGSGKTLSSMGYAKKRNNNLPEEVRRLLKGEVKNPAYLASRTISIPLRDIAMMEFFNQISDNEKWVWKQSLINIELDATTNRPTAIFDDDGVINYKATNSALEGAPKKIVVRKVTPYFLDKEADRILDQSYSAPEEDRKDMQDLAQMMKRAASQALANMDAVPSDFIKMPNIAKYGSLRGLVVHKLIYDDLVGTINTYGATGEQTALENFFGNNGLLARITSAFKFSHVAVNIPTQVTNLLSNGILLHTSGVRFDKVPVRVIQAFKEVLNNGTNYQKMVDMGGRKATFSNQELKGITDWLLENEAEFSDKDMDWFSMTHLFRELSYLTGKTVRSANNLHQNIEMIFKVAKFIDMKAKGATDETAAVMAHRALFDYSFIPRWAKWLRTVPMGIPFITWTIKSFESTLRTVANRPTALLPYYMLGYALSLAAAADFGDDGEDKLKAILKLLPERMQRGGSVWILPMKDDVGRTQLIDMKNLFPWGKTAEGVDALSKLVGNQDVAELRTLADAIGVFSSPITQAVVAIDTNRDAFTGKQIIDENDTSAQKLQTILEYTYGMMMPPMLGSKGDIATIIKSQSPSSYEGIMNKDGSPKKTEEQAFIHLFTGLSIKSVDVDFERHKKIEAFNNMITGIKAQRTKELRANPNLGEEERRIVREKYDARIERVKEKKQKFKDETDVLK
jgi:SAM-dependent methyltransferase